MMNIDEELKVVFDEEDAIVKMLKTAICDELLASFQYWTCYQMSRGKGKSDSDPEFKQHYEEEQKHAEDLMLRLNELGGSPISDPTAWSVNSSAPFIAIETTNVKEMLKITIEAEKNAIAFYKLLIGATKDGIDPTTHKLAKSILSDEEEHLYDLRMLLQEQEED